MFESLGWLLNVRGFLFGKHNGPKVRPEHHSGLRALIAGGGLFSTILKGVYGRYAQLFPSNHSISDNRAIEPHLTTLTSLSVAGSVEFAVVSRPKNVKTTRIVPKKMYLSTSCDHSECQKEERFRSELLAQNSKKEALRVMSPARFRCAMVLACDWTAHEASSRSLARTLGKPRFDPSISPNPTTSIELEAYKSMTTGHTNDKVGKQRAVYETSDTNQAHGELLPAFQPEFYPFPNLKLAFLKHPRWTRLSSALFVQLLRSERAFASENSARKRRMSNSTAASCLVGKCTRPCKLLMSAVHILLFSLLFSIYTRRSRRLQLECEAIPSEGTTMFSCMPKAKCFPLISFPLASMISTTCFQLSNKEPMIDTDPLN
ncbi:uncharacterized protein MYCFIDRAFT_176359 [Pseudocercospora fijiensis CIRAD86]|uniref:Uncharacterized protein n=1 Tax=Pseudocercospora fijiensis (strain CIRAD86) TaxID=383855 RepID=M2YTD2_PSEFD|nr:uncharacterized protein MYCFIDRAFT_176359 [Pseudocercospora fijiensis CIRAD86]EME81015.1 hypothetical protein MYCFIDRAFT_176359 [Pseudocercospora fijiensis CIRAD86]